MTYSPWRMGYEAAMSEIWGAFGIFGAPPAPPADEVCPFEKDSPEEMQFFLGVNAAYSDEFPETESTTQ